MDAERWLRVQEVFERAVEEPPDRRDEYLAGACAGDETLRRDVQALLDGDASPSFVDLGTPQIAHALLDGHVPTALEGTRVGPYRLGRRLGEGGSGVVYLAERDDIGSTVAIKVLRDAWVSPARRDRFVREQRVLARLHHVSIARILDAGVHGSGVPWFAMEYVEGVPLDAYCQARVPSVDAVVPLLIEICDAVQYAHEQLVVHRDLKPSNILIAADGTPKLLDFGISRQLEDLETTPHVGPLRFLTPAYAAPEEMRGEPSGVQGDVYSLGVILRDLLAHARRGMARGRRLTWPTREIDRELDLVCAKATAADPRERYHTAEALRRDLAALRARRPLTVRPRTVGYVAGKFISRHRRTLAAAAVATAVLAGLGGYTAHQLAEARRQAQAESARMGRLLRFVLGLFDGGGDGAPPADMKVVDLLGRGVEEASALADDPLVQAELFDTLGRIHVELGDLAEAERLSTTALTLRRQHLATPHADVADSVAALAEVRAGQARLDEAMALAGEATAMVAAVLPARHPLALRVQTLVGRLHRDRGQYDMAIRELEAAVAGYGTVAGADPGEMAGAVMALAETYFYTGRLDQSAATSERALAMVRAHHGPRHPSVAHGFLNLAAVATSRGRFGEAEQHARDALGIFDRWYGPDHPETASATMIVAQALVRQDRLTEALPLLQRARSVQVRALGARHPRTAFIENEIGLTAFRLDDLDLAAASFARAIDGYRGVAGKHFQEAVSIANRGSVHLARQDNRRAEADFLAALAIYAQVLPDDHLNVAITRGKLGRALIRQRRFAQAEPHLRAAVPVLQKQPGPESSWLKAAREDLAAVDSAR